MGLIFYCRIIGEDLIGRANMLADPSQQLVETLSIAFVEGAEHRHVQFVHP